MFYSPSDFIDSPLTLNGVLNIFCPLRPYLAELTCKLKFLTGNETKFDAKVGVSVVLSFSSLLTVSLVWLS